MITKTIKFKTWNIETKEFYLMYYKSKGYEVIKDKRTWYGLYILKLKKDIPNG